MDIQNHVADTNPFVPLSPEVDAPRVVPQPVDDPLPVDPQPNKATVELAPDKRSSIAQGVKKHFTKEELRAGENWESKHRDLVPKNFNQGRSNGIYDPYVQGLDRALARLEGEGRSLEDFDVIVAEDVLFSRSQGLIKSFSSPKRRKALTQLQAILNFGDFEDALGAYLEWEEAGCSGKALGPLAKKYNLAHILESLARVQIFLMMAEKVCPGFDALKFSSEAKKHFAELKHAWSFIQREPVPVPAEEAEPVVKRGKEWATIDSLRSGKANSRPSRKRDPQVYGSYRDTARGVMTDSDPLPVAAPTIERSAFGPSPYSPGPNSAVVPANILTTPLREECKVLENGLLAYLSQFPTGDWGKHEQQELVDIVNLRWQECTLKKIAERIGRSVKTVQNRIAYLKEWAGST
jgi:hypothetical protein